MLRTASRTSIFSSRGLVHTSYRPAFAQKLRSSTRQYSNKEPTENTDAASEPFTEGTADAKSSGENSESPITQGVDANNSQKGGAEKSADASADASAGSEKLQTLEKQVAEMKDKYIRQVAEYRNLQSRTERDVIAAKDFAIQKFAKDLIESVDNLERALETVPKAAREDSVNNPDLASLYGGLKMTESILMKTLERHGLKKFSGMGERFNPNLHEVLYEAPVPDGTPGTIMQVQSTGFTLNGRTIRAAKVGVVKDTSSD